MFLLHKSCNYKPSPKNWGIALGLRWLLHCSGWLWPKIKRDECFEANAPSLGVVDKRLRTLRMKNRWTQSLDDHFSGTSIFAAATTSFMRIGPQVSHDLLNWTANIYCWAYKTWVETQDPSGRTSHSMEYDNGMPMVQVVETPLAIKSHHLGLAHGLDAYLLLSYTP